MRSSQDLSTSGRDDRDSSGEEVTDRRRIVGLLQGLRTSRSLLSARITGVSDWCNTAVIKADGDTGYVYLDELTPPEAHRLVRPGTQMRIVGVLNGVPLHFSVQIDDKGVYNDIAYYRAPLPDVVDYQQRRALFRAAVPRQFNLKVDAMTQDNLPVSGRLVDVSLGGFGAVIPTFPELKPLDSMTITRLELPDQQVITGNAQVRYVNDDASENFIRIGALFIDLQPQCQRTLHRSILALEREHLRKVRDS